MTPRNVDVSLYDAGGGTLKVWSCTFTLKGSLDGKPGNEKKVKKLIERLISGIEIPDDLNL